MRRRNIIVLLAVLMTIICLDVGQTLGQSPPSNFQVQQNELKDAQNASAAARKGQGQMRSSTNDDKRAAAERNAERRAAAARGQGTGGGQ